MKKGISLFLTFIIVLCVFSSMPLTANAATYIKSPSSTTGSNYTSSSILASALNQIFNGDIDVYSNSGCSSEVSMVLGSSMSTSTTYYVKSKTTGNVISGKQCYIYANAVYNRLFNEWVGHGSSFSHSQVVISGGSNSVSYNMFNNAGVRCGAYMRTTNNSNGAYNGNSGHSLIVLSYDNSYITYLEGNANGNGLIRITKQTWNEFNTGELSGRSRYISHIVQPTESYYQSLYPITPQTYTISYNANGGTGAPASQTKTHGVALKLSTTIPTRKGYSLWGWSYTPTGTPPAYSVGGIFEVNANTTLYAIWRPNTYTVVYNGNGNTGGSTAVSSHQYCDSFVKSSGEYYNAYEFMQTGHDLSPVIDSGGTGKYLVQFDLYSDVAGKTRVYAQNGSTAKYTFWQDFDATTSWKHYSFIVDVSLQDSSVSQTMLAFYGGYGTGCNPHVKNIVFTKANENLSPNGFTRNGYSFLGWSTNPNATTPTYTNKQAVKNLTANDGATVTLYAVWQKDHSHSYIETVTKEPTCTQSGVRTYKCSCGVSYTRSISAKGHSESSWFTDKEANVNAPGTKHKECTVCGEVLETAVIPQLKPATPKLSSVANTASGAKLTWGAVEGADDYIVYRRTYNAKTKKWSGWSKLQDGVTSTAYVDKTAKSGTYYIYTVKANNEAGYGGHTSGLKTYFLATPKVTSTANTNSAITVKWGKVTGAGGYYVYRKTTGGWTRIGKTTGTSFTDKTAKAGVTYRYTVRAYYGSYLSSFVSKGYAVRRLTTPTLKGVTSAKAGVTFKWNKVTGATGYIVYRKTGNGSWQRLGTVKTNSYLDKTTKKGVTYKYTVRAYYGTSTSYYNTKGLIIKDKY